MNFQRCQILGFGRLASLKLHFRDGLNLVFAPNEGGKSTLQRLLMALLYGQLRPDIRAQRRLDPWVEKYQPWRGTDYGGMLWCRLLSGRELEIRRAFGKEETRVEIRTATGEDVTGEYERQRNGEVLFANAHLGMPKELFESVAVVQENQVGELRGRDSLRDRIANLAQAGSEDLSIRQSLGRLEEALEAVGSDRAPTRPYRQALEKLDALQAERTALVQRRSDLRHWVEDRNRLAAEVTQLEAMLAKTTRIVLEARWVETAERTRTLEDLERELLRLRGEIESSKGDPAFPAHHLDELNRLVGALESVGKRLAGIHAESEAAQSDLSQTEARRQELARYEVLQEGDGAEKITEWFVSYLGLARRGEEARRSLDALLNEKAALQAALNQLGPVLSSGGTDWQRKAREAAEAERTASHRIVSLTEQVSGQKAEVSAIRDSSSAKIMLTAIALLLAIAPLGARALFEPGPVYLLVGTAWAAGFGLLAILSYRAAAKSRRMERRLAQSLEALGADLAALREESRKPFEALRAAAAQSGLNTVEEFLSAAQLADQYRQKIEDADARVSRAAQERERIQAECDEAYGHLRGSLAKVGLSCSPGNLKAQVDTLRANLRLYRERVELHRNCLKRIESLRAAAESLARESEQNEARLRAILAEAGAESPKAFRAACQEHLQLLQLQEKESSRMREFQRLCGGTSVAEWKEKLGQLEELRRQSADYPADAAQSASGDGAPEGMSPLLPYIPSTQEAEEEEKRIASELVSRKTEHARLVERVNQAFHNLRTESEIEEDLALAERSVQEIECNRAALTLALQTLQDLSREQQEVLAPQLNSAVESRFLRLCRRGYDEVKIDPDFQVWVREAGTGAVRAAESLSRGTQDQLYFALRFGLLDLVSTDEEPCPCLLDEPFAAYDRERIEEAFQILEEEGRRRQLLLFTCREDVRDLAGKYGAHLIRLTIDD